MATPRIDDRDWSALTTGQRIRPLFADRNTRHWDYHGGNKPPNMASEAPGMDPSRWERA